MIRHRHTILLVIWWIAALSVSAIGLIRMFRTG